MNGIVANCNDSQAPVALVTGATGYIGSQVVRRLATDGWTVHAVARSGSQLDLLAKVRESVSLHRHDGTTGQLFDIMRKASPDIVFHLAAVASVTHTSQDVVPMLRSNIEFGTQLVEAMLENRVYALVNTGTFSQHYGNRDYDPSSLYDATKQAFRDILKFYTETTPLKVVTLELYDNYGPDDPRSKIMNLLKGVALTGTPLAMSPGEQLVDLVYIDDLVEAYLVAAERHFAEQGTKDEAYAVSSGQPMSLKELVRVFEEASGRRLRIEWGGRAYRPREIMVPWNKGVALPGWKAKVALRDGIVRLMNSGA